MTILTVGIDLAKNVFAVHGIDEHGKPVLVRPVVPRARLHELIASLPPCTVAMEACTGAHHKGSAPPVCSMSTPMKRSMEPKMTRCSITGRPCGQIVE